MKNKDYTDYKLKSGNILRVIQDESPESPNDWRNEDMFLVYDHRDFAVIRKGFEPIDIHNYIQSLSHPNDDYDVRDYSNYYIFPVDAYIHSGVNLSLANTKNLPDRRWDVSTTGYILVSKEDMDFNLQKEHNPELENKTDEEIARHYAEGLIETWNQYLNGDIYGFQVLKPYITYTITEEDLNNLRIGFDGKDSEATILVNSFLEIASKEEEFEQIDSCWGFYGSNPKTNGMLDHIDDELSDEVPEKL